MTNLNILESFRTKEELINYFDEMGQNVTEEEIDNLKKRYEQTEINNNKLSLQQLGNVAGGMKFIIRPLHSTHNITDVLFNFSTPEDRIRAMQNGTKDEIFVASNVLIQHGQHDPRISDEELKVANQVFTALGSEQRLSLLKSGDPTKISPVLAFISANANIKEAGISKEEMRVASTLYITGGRKSGAIIYGEK